MRLRSSLAQIWGLPPVRYFTVALIGFAVDFFAYALVLKATNQLALSHVTGFVIGGSLNVLLIRSLVFRDSRFSLHKDIALTLGANGLMMLLGLALLWALVHLASMEPHLAKLMTNGTTFSLNYVTRKLFFTAHTTKTP